MVRIRKLCDEMELATFCNNVGPKNIISVVWKGEIRFWFVIYNDPDSDLPISQDEIKNAYKQFDDMYEEAEIPPYNAAYNYFEAGVRYAEKHYRHA